MIDILRLLRLMRPWAGWILLGVFVSVLTLLANVTLMAMSGWFIASMALAGLAGVSMNYFTPAAVIRAMAITRTVGRYVERLVTHEATLRLVAHLRRWFYDRLEPLAPSGLQSERSGDLFSRIGADISVLENFYLRTLVPSLVALITLPLFVLFNARYSPVLAFGMACLYGMSGLILPLALRYFGKTASQQLVLQQAQIRTDLVEGLQGMREMLVYGRDCDFRHALQEQSQDLSNSQKHLANLQAASQSTITLAANCAIFLVLLTIVPQIEAGLLSGPSLPMLGLFVLASFEAILPLPLAVQSLIAAQMAARRLFAIADKPPLVVETSDALEQLASPSCPKLQLDAVTLRYPEQEKPAFSNLSLTLLAGKSVAIVGPSGSGKSSMINALTGFWPIEKGQILLDGVPHNQMTGEPLRAYFAVAPQHPHIFNSTVRGNLLLANESASDEDLYRVCAHVELSDLIASMPKGLDTFVGEAGETLSGGQIKRLALARALLSPAPILILDEPGEGLDPRMERRILENIVMGEKGRSIILITHRKAGLNLVQAVHTLSAE